MTGHALGFLVDEGDKFFGGVEVDGLNSYVHNVILLDVFVRGDAQVDNFVLVLGRLYVYKPVWWLMIRVPAAAAHLSGRLRCLACLRRKSGGECVGRGARLLCGR